jgi:hypothetical protein
MWRTAIGQKPYWPNISVTLELIHLSRSYRSLVQTIATSTNQGLQGFTRYALFTLDMLRVLLTRSMNLTSSLTRKNAGLWASDFT